MSDLLFVIQNIFTVLPKDIANMNETTLIQAPIITAVFYFLSRWFKAYILRLGLFLFGSLVLYQVFKGQSFLFRFDFYAGLGLLLPHIEIVELTYLILREKVFAVHYKTLAFLEVIARPFVWLYVKFNYFKEFNKAKQEEKQYNQDKSEYERKSREFKQEQNRKQQYQESPRQETPKQETYQWWESPNDYEVLQLNNDASKNEIEKAKNRLRKIYHPDLVFNNEEKRKKHTIIFQNVHNAYEKLIKKFP